MDPVVVTPGKLNEEAVGLSGEPILLVGRVLEYRQRTSDSLDYSSAELKLAAPGGGYVWAGLGGTIFGSNAERGEVVVLRGVVTALGRVGEGATARQVAYFTDLERVSYFDVAELPSNVRATIREVRKG